MVKSRTVTRERLLNAAARLVMRERVSRLTIEGVAREAGVSKGTVLYHFPSKDKLIAGMLEYHAIERFEREVCGLLESSYSGEGSWVRAYADATFNPEDEERDLPLQGGLLAAAANNPGLLEPLRERYRAFWERAENDGIDPDLAMVVILASEGLWFLELLGLPAVPAEHRERVLGTLLGLTQGRTETESEPGAPREEETTSDENHIG